MPPRPPNQAAGRRRARLPPLREAAALITPAARRELIICGVALLCGLILMPFLIWFAGNRVLGPYTHGQNPHAGPWALFGDYFVGLYHGSAVSWAVALGPLLLLLLLRGFIALVRALPPMRGG